MKGPHKLSRANVGRRVDRGIGVYTLHNARGGPVRYVGRSTDLVERLRKYVGRYKFFRYEYQPNISEAYIRETNLYHYHGGKEVLDNKRHPRRPHKRVKCQRCGVHD